MRRVIGRSRPAERGATSVVVAVLLVVLLGFGALGVDVANMASDKQQLQNGADAAALAIAQDCAKGNCGAPASTASTMAALNKAGASGVVETDPLTPAIRHVTVRTSATTSHWFGPVIGKPSSPISARATAVWEPPSGATSFPLTISYCELTKQPGVTVQSDGSVTVGTTSGMMTFYMTAAAGGNDKADFHGCPVTGASGSIPGGFGHIAASPGFAGSCYATTTQNSTTTLGSNPGNGPDNDCTSAYYQSLLGKVILIPVFNAVSGSGSNATYTIHGYAAFQMYSYYLNPGQFKEYIAPETDYPCQGNDRCIRGRFVTYVFPDSVASVGGSAPNLGATVVRLSG